LASFDKKFLEFPTFADSVGEASHVVMVRNGSTTVLTLPKRYFRVTPRNGHQRSGPAGPFSAKSDVQTGGLLLPLNPGKQT
jgi:hypothetical protein